MKKEINNNTKIIIEYIFVNVIFHDKKFDKYLINLESEISKIQHQFDFNIKSIYVAGNDLLKLSTTQLAKFLTLLSTFVTNNLIEYSFECSYDLASEAQFKLLKTYHVNRIVWKVITFQPKLLTLINSHYDINIMINNINISKKLGFNNFSCDLKYNLLHQKDVDIIFDLKAAISINTPHISYDSYNDKENSNIRAIINELLVTNGYYNYEVFSYSKFIKWQSQQTLGYLTMKNWYGCGPEAASFIKNGKQCLTIINNKQWKTKTKVLSRTQYYQTVLIQGLMMKQGLELNSLTEQVIKCYQEIINSLIKQKLLIKEKNTLKATKHGWLLLNEILTVIINNK